VLEPGNSGAALWMPGIGLVLLFMSFAVFFWVVPALGKPVGS
jgi:isoprenylcysteine carboxyl methyltransferase (ICMT) family protein YpbQ